MYICTHKVIFCFFFFLHRDTCRLLIQRAQHVSKYVKTRLGASETTSNVYTRTFYIK